MGKPVHLDYTTIFGAAQALDPSAVRESGLPLSRLLCLSQLVEAIVLHEEVQFEFPSSPRWQPYRVAFERSPTGQELLAAGFPLSPCDEEIGEQPSDVLAAARATLGNLGQLPLRHLLWAVQFRSGTYAGIREVDDKSNPHLQRYLDIVRESGDPVLIHHLDASLAYLNANHIGALGLHTVLRIALLQRHWQESGRAHYYPHFSRQPLIASASRSTAEEWTMEQLRSIRERLRGRNHPEKVVDPLEMTMSPVFLAALSKVRAPTQILEAALQIRETDAARQYRDEVQRVLSGEFGPPAETAELWRVRLAERIANLQDLLFDRGQREEYRNTWLVGLPIQFGWTAAKVQTSQVMRHPGDRAFTFVSDVLRMSLGIVSAQEKIASLWRVPVNYDPYIISCSRPS